MTDQTRNQKLRELLLQGISEIKSMFTGLDEFFVMADEEIAKDEDDPREGLGRLPGLDRLIFLVPAMLARLESDVNKSGDLPPDEINAIIESLPAIMEAAKGVLAWYKNGDVDKSLEMMAPAVKTIQKHSAGRPDYALKRFFSDLARIEPDFRILKGVLESFQWNHRLRPEDPDETEWYSVERWLEYYRDQMRREEPMMALIDDQGLSDENLIKGWEQTEQEYEREMIFHNELLSGYKLATSREAVFDPENPAAFLDLPEIPPFKEDEDSPHTNRPEQPDEAGTDSAEPWTASLPELGQWDKQNQHLGIETDKDISDFRNDPAYQLLFTFASDVSHLLTDDFIKQLKAMTDEEKQERTIVLSTRNHYVIMLGLKAVARLSSCGVMEEEVGHPAPRHGAYRFAMECLGKMAGAIEKCYPPNWHYLAQKAHHLKDQIRKLIV